MKILVVTALLMYVFGSGSNTKQACCTNKKRCNAPVNKCDSSIAGISFTSSLIVDSKMLVQ